MTTDLFKVLTDPRGFSNFFASWVPPCLFASGYFFVLLWPALPLDVRTGIAAPFLGLGLTRGSAWLLSAGLGAFLLQAFSRGIYRVLEGYPMWPSALLKHRCDSHLNQINRLRAIEVPCAERNKEQRLAAESSKPWGTAHSLREYPLEKDWVMPTLLGKRIARPGNLFLQHIQVGLPNLLVRTVRRRARVCGVLSGDSSQRAGLPTCFMVLLRRDAGLLDMGRSGRPTARKRSLYRRCSVHSGGSGPDVRGL